jgi:hypothetical protein
MTFTSRFAPKKLLVGSIAALALSLSTGAFASVSAMGGNGHGVNPPVVANQCDHPGYRHFGFASKKACTDYVSSHTPGRGQGGGNGHGYGGGGGQDSHNIFVSISNVVNSAVNITINFVTNIFS